MSNQSKESYLIPTTQVWDASKQAEIICSKKVASADGVET